MPKYYVESGWVRMVLDAKNAEQAAVKAFHRCRERQAEIYAEAPSDTIRDAEAVEWQLADEIEVNETGFRGCDGETFATFEIAAIGLGDAASASRSFGCTTVQASNPSRRR